MSLEYLKTRTDTLNLNGECLQYYKEVTDITLIEIKILHSFDVPLKRKYLKIGHSSEKLPNLFPQQFKAFLIVWKIIKSTTQE